ncbi:MAG TPA: YdeI/OmpD-associated family protein [Candidatus Saccharimonadales bacterium]|nr:YdeI/OmpD-associated family protein [Candidatus Saccharimonadales bacterium]
MAAITFKTTLYTIDGWTILRLPASASAKLPSRAMTMVAGKLNGTDFRLPLEPDGVGSHWFKVEDTILKSAAVSAGDTVKVAIEPSKEWVRPEVPADLRRAFAQHPEAQKLWAVITPNAQWDWIRWIRATNNPETRKRRIEVACSKMKKGMRRPCCFNRNVCTEPAVSHNWMLKEPQPVTAQT